MLAMEIDHRRSAQARIAASAPRITYGKHKNKLLPLTGSQFLRTDVFGTVEKRALAKDFAHGTHQQSSADESPLSDAEPPGKKQGKRQIATQKRQPRAPTKSRSAVKPTRREAGDVPGAYTDTEEDEERVSRSPSLRRDKSVVGHQRSRRSHPSAHKKGKLKSAGVVRGRLPLNELVLVAGARNDDVFDNPDKNRKTLLRDPIISSAQPLIDAVSSEHSETTPAKRKAKAPLSAIRKRLRTPSSGHKSLEHLRRKYNAAQITPTGSQARQIAGDGFEPAELTPSHPFRYTVKHSRRQPEPLLAGLKALSLASGPLPEVVFLSGGDPSQLKLAKHDTSDCNGTASGHVAPATITPPTGVSDSSSNRRVSFDYDAERAISAQLSSVSAPRRQPSIALGSEDEVEEDDDGDEAGDEEEDDDEAADTYLDQDELPPEESHMTVDRLREIQTDLPSAHSQPESPAPELAHRTKRVQRSVATCFNGFVADANRPRTPSLRRRTFSGRPLLNEVNEPIFDDFQVDDMLLDDEVGEDLATMSGSVQYITSNLKRDPHQIPGAEVPLRSSSRGQQEKQTTFCRTSSAQPRSILKNGTPHISSDTTRPESTAANTRRNSMVDVEESRYFSAAKDQLESTPTKHTIIRKKSSSRFFEPIEVPYSDEMVLETSPKKPDYTNMSQLHLLKRTNEAMWTSSAAPVPQTNLANLTRSASRDNGTLSQSVRRRSSLRFQSPKKLV